MHVLVYCDSRIPNVIGGEVEHWKDEIPSLGASEVIRNFKLVAKQGTKRIFHCVIRKTAQLSRVLVWIINYNDGKADQDKIWYWVGPSANDVFTDLWQDANSFAHSIAERVLQYPVTVQIDGQDVTKFVSVYDAINTHGASIVPAVLKQYGVPHKFLGEE